MCIVSFVISNFKKIYQIIQSHEIKKYEIFKVYRLHGKYRRNAKNVV